MTLDPICRRCEHTLSAHCPGGVAHTYHKEDLLPANRRKHTTVCHTRHCNNPLCSCVDFVSPLHQEAA